MDKIKNIINVKNVLCMSCAVALGAGFFIMHKEDTSVPDLNTIKVSKDGDSSEAAETQEEKPVEKVYLAASVPELSCKAIEFDDGSVVFADSEGAYAILDPENNKAENITIRSDDDKEITLTCGDSVAIQSGGEDVAEFLYNGHTIRFQDDLLYYDDSLVEYSDNAFSAYSFNDKIAIECTSKGKYVLRKSDGTVTETAKVTDDYGTEVTLHANDDGFMAIDNDGLLEIALKFNDDVVVTSMSYEIYINGETLVPPGYNDEYVNPDITAAKEAARLKAEEEAKKAEEEEKKKKKDDDDEEEEKKPNYSNVSETPLTPELTPAERGYVNTSNDSASELTIEMLGYVNEVREQYGLEKIYGLGMLDKVTAVRVKELKKEYSHTRPNGKSYETALDEAGVMWWSCRENIAYTDTENPHEVFEAWMSSEEHRAVILDPNMKYMSLSKQYSGISKYYWDQMFISDIYIPDKTASESEQ